MSKDIKEFQICVLNYSDASVHIFTRALPSDIQCEELEEILSIEGLYSPKDCYLMYSSKLEVEIDL